MLLNGGVLDGQRILGRKTVELMRQNRLTDLPEPHTGSPSLIADIAHTPLVDEGCRSTPLR
jgi:hypothetical protein